MKLLEATKIYYIIARSCRNNDGLIKNAFDTRRINQNTQYNPRRNLQYFLRETPFINQQDEMKIEAFAKLKEVVGFIKDDFLGEPEWFDSYASDLDHSLEKIFYMADGKNFDFSTSAIQHLEQLLQDRYRLTLEDINSTDISQLKTFIIKKDEKLEKSSIYKFQGVSKINQIKSKEASYIMDATINNILKDEKNINILSIEEDKIKNKISKSNSIKKEVEDIKKSLVVITSKERESLNNLWYYHNSIQKLINDNKKSENDLLVGTQNIDNLTNNIKNNQNVVNELFKKLSTYTQNNDLIKEQNYIAATLKKISSDQQKIKNAENNKLKLETTINNRLMNIDNLTNNMIKERTIYDAINMEKLSIENQLNIKISEEVVISKEIIELEKIKDLHTIGMEKNILQMRMRDNINKLGALQSVYSIGSIL